MALSPESHSSPASPKSDEPATPMIPVRLFVNRVPSSMTNEELRDEFARFGTILQCNILQSSAGPRGCAFVKYRSVADAHAAVVRMHNSKSLDEAGGLGKIQVRYADGEIERLGLSPDVQPGGETIKLFVGCLPKAAAEEDLVNLFSRFGRVDEVYIIRDAHKQPKCSAFVVYPKMTMAQAAIRCLDRQYTMPNGRRPIEVRLAESKNSKQRLQRVPGASNFIPNSIPGIIGPRGQPCFYAADNPNIGGGGSTPNYPISSSQTCGASTAVEGTSMRHMGGAGGAAAGTRPMMFGALYVGSPPPFSGPGTYPSSPNSSSCGAVMTPVAGNEISSYPCNVGVLGGGMPVPPPLRASGVWREYVSPDGRTYYYNSLSNVSQWEAPAEFENGGACLPPSNNNNHITSSVTPSIINLTTLKNDNQNNMKNGIFGMGDVSAGPSMGRVCRGNLTSSTDGILTPEMAAFSLNQ